jgi:hypothetical protein
MSQDVNITYRGAAYELGRGPHYYAIWAAGAPRSQPLEWWPESPEGWHGAWSRFTGIEQPGSIVPVIQPRATAAAAGAAPDRRFALVAAGLLILGVVVGIAGLFPQYNDGASLTSQPPLLWPHLIYFAAWAASAALLALGGTRLPAGARKAGALLGAGVSVVTLGLYFGDLAQVMTTSSRFLGAGLVLGLIGWLACAAGSGLAVFRLRPEPKAPVQVLIAGDPALQEPGTAQDEDQPLAPGQPHDQEQPLDQSTLPGTGQPGTGQPGTPAQPLSPVLTQSPVQPTAHPMAQPMTQPQGPVQPQLQPPGPVQPQGPIQTRKPMHAPMVSPVLILVLAVIGAIGAAVTFIPSWDRYVLHAQGATQTVTAGYAFAEPGLMIVGDVAVVIALVAVAVLAGLWRPLRLGGALLAGAIIPMAAQAVSALIQLGEPTSPLQFGISSAQASGLGLTISNGVTPAFWIFCIFIVALIGTCAQMLVRPRA